MDQERSGAVRTPPVEANMADVARLAGVSIATVSRALRDLPGVSAATRERVRGVADELSYVVSPAASALSGRRTGRVAVVVPRLDIWFYSAMLAGMEPVLREGDLDVLVYQVDGPEQRERFLRELPARRKVDAAILTALPMSQREVDRLERLGVHMVVAGGRVRDFPRVEVDDYEVGRLAVQHLLDLGHRSIAMIRTSDTDGTSWSPDTLRVRAWRETMSAAGLEPPPEHLVTVGYDVLAGAEAMARLLGLECRPTAVFAYSDELAASAVGTARSRGLSVPEDVSVVGVDGHPVATMLALTSIDQSVVDQGRLAAQMVIDLLGGQVVGPAVTVPATLVVRGSTAPPRP